VDNDNLISTFFVNHKTLKQKPFLRALHELFILTKGVSPSYLVSIT